MTDSITIEPTLQGPATRAWAVSIHERDWGAGVAAWVIEAPWAHNIWHSYMITLIHLRPVPELPDAKIYLPEATHEMGVLALNPDYPREPVIRGLEPPHYLTPVNFACQWRAQGDSPAAQDAWSIDKAETEAVVPVVAGTLNPDTDFVSMWIARFGDSMVRRNR